MGIVKKAIGGIGGLVGGGGIGGTLAGGALGGIPGALLGSGVLPDIGNAISGAFDPSQRVVSGVPDELKAALAAAGINIEELIKGGGALPQFGGATGTAPNLEQLRASSSLQRQLNTQRTGPDLTDFNSILEQLGETGTGDLTDTNAIIKQLRDSGADLSTSDSILKKLQGLKGPDTSRAAGLLGRVELLATGGNQQRLMQTLLPSLEKATAADRFDLSDTFKQGEAVFKSDLEQQMADIKAESSALGLGAGSSDRNRRLLETAGKETSRFRLGQQDIARESFEDAESRRIAAINAGGAVSGAVGRPAETLASIVPAALQEGGAGADFDLQKLLGGLDPSIRAALGVGGLEQAGAASALPTAFQAGLSGDQMTTDKLLAMLNPSLEGGQVGARFDLAGRGQQSRDLSSLFGMGTTNRNFGESEIDRLMAEFGRTQTGGFDLLARLMAATPESTTAFGPSTVSQLANLGEGIAGVVSAGGGGGAASASGGGAIPSPANFGGRRLAGPGGEFGSFGDIDFGAIRLAQGSAGDRGFTPGGMTAITRAAPAPQPFTGIPAITKAASLSQGAPPPSFASTDMGMGDFLRRNPVDTSSFAPAPGTPGFAARKKLELPSFGPASN